MKSILVRIMLALVIVMTCMTSVPAAGSPGQPAKAPASRILHFPADRSLGKLMSRPARPEAPVNTFVHWSGDEDWAWLGQAQGDVTVPAGHQVSLVVSQARGWRDLSPLLRLGPDDLYRLSLYGSQSAGRPGDSCMQYIAHLRGLCMLDLRDTNISGAAMKHVTGLKRLQWLTVPGRMDDKGMVLIAEMPWLTGLFFKENLVTNAGLAHLAKLTSLETLELGGTRITDAGLAPGTIASPALPDALGQGIHGFRIQPSQGHPES